MYHWNILFYVSWQFAEGSWSNRFGKSCLFDLRLLKHPINGINNWNKRKRLDHVQRPFFNSSIYGDFESTGQTCCQKFQKDCTKYHRDVNYIGHNYHASLWRVLQSIIAYQLQWGDKVQITMFYVYALQCLAWSALAAWEPKNKVTRHRPCV